MLMWLGQIFHNNIPLKWLLGMEKLILTFLWLFQSSGMPSAGHMLLQVDNKIAELQTMA